MESILTKTSHGPVFSVPEVSVVIPCYNEVEGIECCIRDWNACLEEDFVSFEIVVINDGSTDGTGRILDKLRREIRQLRVIHQLNIGQGKAIRRGYEAARGEFILQVEANGAHEPSDIRKLWESRKGYGLVLGYRTHRLDSGIRRVFAFLFRQWIFWLFGMKINDIHVPVRMFHRLLAMPFLQKIPPHKKSVNLLLTLIFKRELPDKVLEIPIPYRGRAWGKSHQSFGNRLASGYRSIWDSLFARLSMITRPAAYNAPRP